MFFPPAMGCPVLPVPKNGMMIMVRNDFGYPSCPQSHRAGEPGFPSSYMCVGGKWMRIGPMPPFPSPGEKLVPDCVGECFCKSLDSRIILKLKVPLLV